MIMSFRAFEMLLIFCSFTVSTSEFLLAAVPYTLFQILQLVFHLLILPLCLLTLSPEQMSKTCISAPQYKLILKWTSSVQFRFIILSIVWHEVDPIKLQSPVAVHRYSDDEQHGYNDRRDDDVERQIILSFVLNWAGLKFRFPKLDLETEQHQVL